MNESPLLPGLARPVPMPDGLDAAYWQGLAAGELRIQRCAVCGTWQVPPEWICHACHAWHPQWSPVAPEGVVYTWMRVRHPVHPALRERVPYVVVVVTVPAAGNVKLLGNLLGDPEQDVRIGAPVEGVFERHPEGHVLLQWRRASAGETGAT
jgi:uncharacterized OB-fold protein